MVNWWVVVQAVWLFLPAYFANMAPVGAARIAPRWNQSLDGGRIARDGRPMLGANKTWRGLVAGVVAGALLAVLCSIMATGPLRALDFGRSAGLPLWRIAAFGAAVGGFALVGDAVKSFFKRRLDRDPGRPWFPFDQLDAVVGGLLGAWFASPLLPDWAFSAYFGSPWIVVSLLIVSPLLHWLSSVAAYAVGIKKHPW